MGKSIQALCTSLLPLRRWEHKGAVPRKSLEEMGGGVGVESPYGWGNLAEDWACSLGTCKVET